MRRRTLPRFRPLVEALESRDLMAGVQNLGVGADWPGRLSIDNAALEFRASDLLKRPDSAGGFDRYSGPDVMQGTLPLLNSDPAAAKTLYLNFQGNTITEDFA